MFSYEHLDRLRRAEIERVVAAMPPGARVLELGAGTGAQAAELARRGFAVTAIEIPDSNYAAHRLFPIIDYDGVTIPLPDASMDVVFSSNVLEHVPDLARLHAELHRVLAPGGRCLHIVPTHAWRFWTTVTSYPDALLYLLAGIPRLVPRAVPGASERRRLWEAWYGTARRVGGRLLQRRHGERGTLVSETWLFRPGWWRRNFAAHGFVVERDWPVGLFYTGNMLLGSRLSLERRERIARRLGSACHAFLLR